MAVSATLATALIATEAAGQRAIALVVFVNDQFHPAQYLRHLSAKIAQKKDLTELPR